MRHKPDDYQQEQLEFENRKHKTNCYLIHTPLGLRKRLIYFRILVYAFTCYTELAYIENLSLNDTPRSEVHNMFDTILYVMTILPGLNNTIMMIGLITSKYRLCIINSSGFNIINLILKIYLLNHELDNLMCV